MATTSPKVYLGDGVYLTLAGVELTISGNRLGERAITLRPATFRRLIREGLKHLGTLPDEPIDTPAAQERTIPLLICEPDRDAQQDAWEETLRRKRNGAAPSVKVKTVKPITDLA